MQENYASQITDDSKSKLEIDTEQVKMLYDAMPAALAANIVASLLLAYVLSPAIDHTFIIWWLGITIAILLARTLLFITYKQSENDITSTPLWEKRFTIGSSASGLTMGSASIFLFPENQPEYQMVCAFVLIGMASGAVSSLSFGKYTFPLYATLIFLPLMVSMALTRTTISLTIIPMLILAFAFILRSARYIYHNSRQNILFRLQSMKNEAYLSGLLESGPVIIYSCEPDNNFPIKFISENVREIFGYEPEQFLLDQNFWKKGIHSEDLPRVLEDLNHLFEQDFLAHEYRFRINNGVYIWVYDELKLIRDKNGKPTNIIGYWANITERKKIESMKNEFISTVSHELRTPLTSIRGSLGLMNGGAAGVLPERAKDMTRIAYNNTERLLLLINDILDLQKIESGELVFELTEFDIVKLINQSIQDNASYGNEFNVQLKYVSDIKSAQIYSDYHRLMQVMTNLLSNAAKFSPAGETVEISLSHLQNNLQVSVTDHGIGIPEDFRPVLFGKFTQADSSDTRSKGGTGLGLAISKSITENLGGQIYFSSNEGSGTTFTITLPTLRPTP